MTRPQSQPLGVLLTAFLTALDCLSLPGLPLLSVLRPQLAPSAISPCSTAYNDPEVMVYAATALELARTGRQHIKGESTFPPSFLKNAAATILVTIPSSFFLLKRCGWRAVERSTVAGVGAATGGAGQAAGGRGAGAALRQGLRPAQRLQRVCRRVPGRGAGGSAGCSAEIGGADDGFRASWAGGQAAQHVPWGRVWVSEQRPIVGSPSLPLSPSLSLSLSLSFTCCWC